jgi:hypothetical protein
MLLDEVRTSLLKEAQQSPNLLSDLAGLEQYIAESYHTRSFTELLQNADDAGASRFKVQRVGEHIFVANDGRIFNRSDFESLCRSAHSSKVRGPSIGYRGIGFKSVVSFAKSIHLFSGTLEATFSRERTAREIPQAKRVPLIRIPHPVEATKRKEFEREFRGILGEGYTTVFVFGDLVTAEIEAEFESFDFTSLLFLRNVRQVEFQTTATEEIVTVRRQVVDSKTHHIRLATSQGVSLWTVIKDGDIALAFAHDDTGICRLEEQDAVVHAFLPTGEATGLGIKINGDINTDPSRRQVTLDEHTAATIEQIANLIVDVIKDCLTGPIQSENPSALLAALVPSVDPRMMAFKRRSFGKELLYAIQRAAGTSFKNLRCRPSWLNVVDFQKLAHESRLRTLDRQMEEVEGLAAFLRFLGAADAIFDDLSEALVSASPSLLGCAEVVVYLTNRYLTKQVDLSYISLDWRIWPIDESFYSLSEAQRMSRPLNRKFVDMVSEQTTSPKELRFFIEHLTDASIVGMLLPEDAQETADILPRTSLPKTSAEPGGLKRQQLSLKKWRSGEQQVLALLNAQGYTLSDVTRQNLGYDLEGSTPEGSAIFIEVKSIDYPGQVFTLTNNEMAVATQKGEAYFLAIVRQSAETLDVALIQDPANQLEMTRRCQQWVWECSSYDFQPESFPLE